MRVLGAVEVLGGAAVVAGPWRGALWVSSALYAAFALFVVAATGAPVGTVDVVVATADALIVDGWAIDPDTRRPIRVRIEADDGVASPEVEADLVRVDLEVGAPGYGTAHGYRVVFAAPGARRVCAAGLDPEHGTWSIVACADVGAAVSAS